MSNIKQYKLIPLTQDKFAIVDLEDYEKVKDFKWHYNKGYAAKKSTLMHRLIMNAPKDMQVDHINTIRNDNRKSNLRLCTISQNAHNSRPNKGRSYKGIVLDKRSKKWRAQLGFKGTRIYLGLHATVVEALQAYDAGALKYYGEFALTNKKLGAY